MKYSLTNKEFKKRNAIFGQRKAVTPIQQHNLDSIKEMGSDMEDSSMVRFNDYEQGARAHGMYDNREANHQFMQKEKEYQNYRKEGENRFGRHNLIPNSKPFVPIIRTMAVHSPSKATYIQTTNKNLQIQSNVISFAYYNDESREQNAELKQLFLKLSYILLENNQRINQLQSIITNSQKCWKIFSQAMNKSMALVYGLQGKINLFLNTLRDVYQNLRIGKLKQQNLQLYLKQSSLKQSISIHPVNPSNQKNRISSSPVKEDRSQPFRKNYAKRQPNLIVNEKQKECDELLSLLQYESDSSLVETYTAKNNHNHNQQFYPEKGIRKSQQQQSIKNIFNQSIQIHINNDFDPTFRPQRSQFQHFSPFQANKMMFQQPNRPKPYIQSSKQKTPSNHSPHRSSMMKSNWSYSFEQDRTRKIVEWLGKRGQGRLSCWLDEMGCLRRPNMTYCFWSNGDVIRLSLQEFHILEQQGVIKSVSV